jgi:hypothetical protein
MAPLGQFTVDRAGRFAGSALPFAHGYAVSWSGSESAAAAVSFVRRSDSDPTRGDGREPGSLSVAQQRGRT